MPKSLVWALLLAVHVLGCGTSAVQTRMADLVSREAYADALREARSGGRSSGRDRVLAELVLEHELRSPDAQRRQRAGSELQLAGQGARPLLEQLSETSDPALRARTLAALMQLGDRGARDALRGFADDPEPELAALGYRALDPQRDRLRLMAALSLPQSERRLAALGVLRDADPDPQLRAALEAALQHDPEPGVRAGAAAALAGQGALAAPALERATRDSDQAVRLAAISALARSGGEPELARLGRDLGAGPTPESLAAASVLLRAKPPREEPRARAVFERALSAPDAALRGRAATLCRSLGKPGCGSELLAKRLELEPSREVKLLLSLALGPYDPRARQALVGLSRPAASAQPGQAPRPAAGAESGQAPAAQPASQATLPALEAASELAIMGDSAARAQLVAALHDPQPGVRVAALRALARLYDGADIVPSLADPDPRVRCAAASVLLSEP